MATPKGRRAPAPHERQRDPERTKARILDAAIEEFSAKGFAGARVSGIAARAGVNQQLIAYYFDGKEGLYRELGRRWRAYEAAAFPDDMPFAEMIRHYVRTSVEHPGARLLAWEGLADSGADSGTHGGTHGGIDDEEAAARLRHEVAVLRARQEAGELDDRFDPAALVLIGMSAANALTVYPQVARAVFGADRDPAELAEHYAEQLAQLIARLGPA